jgi:hypothetical protein
MARHRGEEVGGLSQDGLPGRRHLSGRLAGEACTEAVAADLEAGIPAGLEDLV